MNDSLWHQPVGRALRWYGALVPLAAALGAIGLGVYLSTHDGNRWCQANAFSCSLNTNLVGVIAIGGATTYWYFGLRRGFLLARYRRRLRERIASSSIEGGSSADQDAGAVATRVVAAHRGWRTPARVTLVTGPSGSAKIDVYAAAVGRLASPGGWAVPVPVGALGNGAPEDLLNSARQQLDLILLDVNANQDLVDWLWRSLLRCDRLLLIIDDIETIAPSMRASDREQVVRRMLSSARSLKVPLFGTGKADLIDSPPGSVLELPPLDRALVRRRLEAVADLDEGTCEAVAAAACGPLATPFMIARVVWLMRRSGEAVLAALSTAGAERADLVLWDQLLDEHQVPGAAIPARELRLLAFSLLTTGVREVEVGDSAQWQDAVDLACASAARLRATGPLAAEVRSYIEGGFLDPGSNRGLLRFASPEVQAVLAAGFVAEEPDRIGQVAEQLGTSATARTAVADALRIDGEAGRVHAALLRATAAQLSPAAEVASLCLALQHAPATLDPQTRGDLAARLAQLLADRAGGGPSLTLSGMRDAVAALDRHVPSNAEKHLLQALHSSSFQTRLSVALALLRRGPQDSLLDAVDSWLPEAESPAASGTQHQLGLALWFCPYLRESDPRGRGGDLYKRGARLAAAADSNPLMFETSLCRGFKLAAWARPNRPVDDAMLDLWDAAPRFWYSRVSLVHAAGIRLAAQPTDRAGARTRARDCLQRATDDPHPLVREAARLTAAGLSAAAPARSFAWLAETDMARANSQLGTAAQRLLGEASLFLNLIYCAEPWADELWQQLAGSDELPACIRSPAQRERRMGSGCPPDCAFGLCPYPGPAHRGRGRGELSGAFCRTQADLASRLPRAPWHDKRSRRQLGEFWLYAEEHLANRDGWEINL